MRSGTDFLLAARQHEIAELEQLAASCVLVAAVGRLIHQLQRERGTSNIYLSSRGARFSQQRAEQAAASAEAELALGAEFDKLDAEGRNVRNGARLFSRIAVAVHGLESLPPLRARVANHAIAAAEASGVFSRIVAALLAVVFEAADAATDPEISRALVALFNFMQGKELAGQERALGARAFAHGAIDAAAVQQWRHLVEMQQASFQAFARFSDPAALRVDEASGTPAMLAELDPLRQAGCREGVLEQELTQRWYEACTRRIDAMKCVEDALAAQLRTLCEQRIAQARAGLHDARAQLQELAASTATTDAAPGTHYGPQLERSILEMVHDQARRLQEMSQELDTVRATLNERKVVDRAKGLLMVHRGLTEDGAYKALRQMAMSQNRRLVDVAEAVLSLQDVLHGDGAR